MVDVTHKPALFREAEAAGEIRMNPATLALIESNQVAKGNVLATARITAGTGIEMEALTAVSVAALTLYDMCKAVDKSMVIGEIRLLRKSKQAILP